VTTKVATFAIPCHNGAAHLRPLLESLLAQTRQDFALLLVDDRSTDGSPALAEAIAGDRMLVVENSRRLGLGGNWNRCAQLVRTPYFCLAHQDDVYEPDYLARMLARLEAAPAAAMVHCQARAIDRDGKELRSPAERYKAHFWRRARASDRAGLYRQLWRGNFVCCPSVLYRTAAFGQVGGFHAGLSFAVDWELWFRLLAAGHDIAAEPAELLRYRRHPAATTRDATRTLTRFLEELAVLEQARRQGLAGGLLAAEPPPSPALRNNLLHEALEDLHAGDAEAARQKLDFLKERLPAAWNDPYVRTFRSLVRLGAPGRALLGLGRGVAVRLGLGGTAG